MIRWLERDRLGRWLRRWSEAVFGPQMYTVGEHSPLEISEKYDSAATERERLMRHTGRPECPIPEHADALRRLGQVIAERNEARNLARRRHDLILLLEGRCDKLSAQLERAEGRLRHTWIEDDAA